jgi:hypothetical protein
VTENKALKPAETLNIVPVETPAITFGEVRKSLDSFVVPPIVPVQMNIAQANTEPPAQIND